VIAYLVGTCRRAFGIYEMTFRVFRTKPVIGPLPEVSNHVIKPKFVRLVCIHRGCQLIAVEGHPRRKLEGLRTERA
jgi:hypothetical protein